ncbi:amino acid adenylation domain-containing protein [Streptomyces sp. NPDC055607]
MTPPGHIPLTAYQLDIWVAAVMGPESPQFNAVLHERLEGDVELPVLADALRRTLDRNEAFRLRFDDRDGEPYQWLSEEPARVEVLDLSGEPDAARRCAALIDDGLRTAVPLRGGPLYEAVLLRESDRVVHLYGRIHHLLGDGWSAHQFVRQVLADYAHARRTGAPLATSPPSLLEAFEEERRYRASEDHAGDRAHWRGSLAGLEPALFTRRVTDDGRNRGRHSFTLDRRSVERARASGVSLFPYLSAVISLYLARVHSAGEVVLGVPFLNRSTGRHLATFGQFANTLPLRVPVSPDATLRGLAASVSASVRAHRGHERLALGEVVREQRGPSSAVGRPFDVTVSYLRHPRSEPTPGLVRTTRMLVPAHDSDALAVMVRDFDDDAGVAVDLNYAGDVFDADFPVEAAAAHLRRLFVTGLDRLDRPVAELAMLSDEEHTDLTTGRAAGRKIPYRADQTVHGLFEERVDEHPDRAAVIGVRPGQVLTYAELDARANQVAHHLRALGIGADSRTAVLMERSRDLPVALLGVLKAGGAYVPLDPGYPPERLAHMVRDSGASLVLTDAVDEGWTPPAGVAVRVLEDLLTGPAERPSPVAGPRDLAYVIYTSGSTGRPKGVMVEHRSVVNRLAWMGRRYPLGATDVLLQKTPTSFDVSVWELFWWAVEGAGLALMPPGAHRDPREILRHVAAHRISAVHFVPSMLESFLDLLEERPELRGDAAGLRFVFSSGEALAPATVERFARLLGSADPADGPRLVNLYGPTEATVDVSHFDCPTDPAAPVRRVPIGCPADNNRLYVLGPHGEPQPVGAPGELCVAGVQVARGYWGRPELTEERFPADPFFPGRRMYRTGDLARWLDDGTVEYLGRSDGQVKIRGNRVELGEVGSALAGAPGVRSAVALDHRGADGRTTLVGYYVADTAVESVVLRDHLAKTLPDFMLPTRFVRLDGIPLTPNGKADRSAFPAPEDGPAPHTPPRTPAEAVLADVWAEVLGLPEVGVHDDYHALGGDSLHMLRIRAEAEKHGLRFSLADLIGHPTVAELAARVEASPAPVDEAAPAPFALVAAVDRARLGGAEDAFPLSRLQLGLIYHSRRDERQVMYNDVFRYSLRMPWDEERLREAFGHLVARHHALRSSFDLAGGSEPLQVVHPRVSGGLEVVDLRGRAEAAEREVARHVEERRRHRYDFGRAPLYLFRFHVRDDGAELVLSFHHALLDGGSVATVVGELLRDYAHGLGLGIGPVPDTALPSPAGFVREERRALARAEAGPYWREVLRSSRPARLPSLRQHQAAADDGLMSHRAVLPDSLTDRVRRFAAEHALSVKSVLLTAHCLTLGLFCGTGDVTTGLVVHGRPEAEGADRTAGLFLNTVPVRLDVTGASGLEAARRVFRREREAHPHRHYPLSAVQEDGGAQVVDTAFNYVHFRQFAEVFGLPDMELLDFETWEQTDFPLLVNAAVDPFDHRIRLKVDCDGRVFGPAQAEMFADAFTAVLDRLISHPAQDADAPLPVDWQEPAVGDGPVPDVVTAFDEQVRRTPDAVALERHGERWTYRRLADTAGRVTRHLLAAGVRPGDRVGVAMDRSPRTVAVLVGVLGAGAVLVPLDTSYPAARLELMLGLARVTRVVADGRATPKLRERVPVLCADALTGADVPEPVADGPGISPGDGAYVLFTSGSTGRPKPVVMPHRGLANLVAWQNGAASACAGTTVQYAPLSFDVSLQEIFSTLCCGGTLLLVDDEERRDSAALLRLMDRSGAERVFLPYVALQQLAETASALHLYPRALRTVVSSGEQLRVTQEIRALLAALPSGAVLENQYGPTETHVVTSHTLTGDPDAFPPLPPVGTPIRGAAVHLLDSRMRPVPAGVVGEIHIGGACLADGYDGQPGPTGERFRFVGPHGERLYRTGDLGVRLPGGAVVCAGRIDAQVKVRGHRVEPAEVELAVNAAAVGTGLRETAVVARTRGEDTVLVAFLVGDERESVVADVRGRLRVTVPEHLVPSRFQWIDRLPLTPSGKRDDAALRALVLPAASSRPGRAEPRDAHERALGELFADLLGVGGVGPDEDLFELGATSLTAMRAVAQIEHRYGVALPLADFLAFPTVAALARRLRRGGAAASDDPLVTLRTGGSGEPLFLVHPLGGNILCYRHLAAGLPGGRPVHAFQAPGTVPGSPPLRGVPEMAAHYVAAMRRERPEGPYALAGWSFGGFVAFEMARQLRAAGQRVRGPVLLDTVALDDARVSFPAGEAALLNWFFWELLWLGRQDDSPVEELPAGLTTTEEKIDHIARVAVAEGVLPHGSKGGVVRRLFRVYEANCRAVLDYRPVAVDQDLTLLRATEPLPEVLRVMHDSARTRYDDPANGWGALTTGRVEVVEVPGDHLSMMGEAHAARVAEALDSAVFRTAADGREGAR